MIISFKLTGLTIYYTWIIELLSKGISWNIRLNKAKADGSDVVHQVLVNQDQLTVQMCPFSSLLLCYLFSGMGFVSIVTVMSCLLLSSATMEAKFSAPVGSKVMVMFIFIFRLIAVVCPLFPHQAPISNPISIYSFHLSLCQPKSCFFCSWYTFPQDSKNSLLK